MYSFLSHIVPGHQRSLRAYGYDYFTFVLIGAAASAYFTVGLSSFAGTLSREQATGTLEALLMAPRDSRVVLAGGATWAFAVAAVETVVFLAGGTLILHAHLATGNLVLLAAMMVMTLASFSGLGLLAAATLILTKRGGTLLGFTASAFGLLGGVMYPISVLPGWLQVVARSLPITYGLDGVRRAALPSPDLQALGVDALVLAVFTAILVPAALVVSGWSVNRARRAGSIAQY
jgi:ABC-2 type transport system permease protein